jgi:hypothetical protein
MHNPCVLLHVQVLVLIGHFSLMAPFNQSMLT